MDIRLPAHHISSIQNHKSYWNYAVISIWVNKKAVDLVTIISSSDSDIYRSSSALAEGFLMTSWCPFVTLKQSEVGVVGVVGSTIACLSSVVYFIFGGSSLKPLQMFTWNRKKCYDDANLIMNIRNFVKTRTMVQLDMR